MSDLPPNERLPQTAPPRTVTSPGMLRTLYDQAILTWRLFWDSRVGPLPKAIPLVAILYLLSPLDLVPELALGPIGVLDDVGLLLLGLRLFIEVSPPDVVREHLRELGSMWRAEPDEGGDVVEGTAERVDE